MIKDSRGVRETEWARRKRLGVDRIDAGPDRLLDYIVTEGANPRVVAFKDDRMARRWAASHPEIQFVRRGYRGPIIYRKCYGE